MDQPSEMMWCIVRRNICSSEPTYQADAQQRAVFQVKWPSGLCVNKLLSFDLLMRGQFCQIDHQYRRIKDGCNDLHRLALVAAKGGAQSFLTLDDGSQTLLQCRHVQATMQA